METGGLCFGKRLDSPNPSPSGGDGSSWGECGAALGEGTCWSSERRREQVLVLRKRGRREGRGWQVSVWAGSSGPEGEWGVSEEKRVSLGERKSGASNLVKPMLRRLLGPAGEGCGSRWGLALESCPRHRPGDACLAWVGAGVPPARAVGLLLTRGGRQTAAGGRERGPGVGRAGRKAGVSAVSQTQSRLSPERVRGCGWAVWKPGLCIRGTDAFCQTLFRS